MILKLLDFNVLMEAINEARSLDKNHTLQIHQGIKGGTSKLLQCSSTVSNLDLGSKSVTTSQMGEGKEYPDNKWYYLFLNNKEMKFYIDIFTGKRPIIIKADSIEDERYLKYKVFPYTSVNHNKRFKNCKYSKEDYASRRDSAFIVKEAFETNSADKLNSLIDKDEILGAGYLFVCAPLEELDTILRSLYPRRYLVTNYKGFGAAEIPGSQMEEFIYLYESMPYNIELMERHISDYTIKNQKIRITDGLFKDKEGCIMRIHRNTKLVLAFGNMTFAISNIHAFPFEKID